MTTIGITGKFGSGKTTIARYLKEKYPDIGYIEADELVNNNTKLYDIRHEILVDTYNNLPKNIVEDKIKIYNKELSGLIEKTLKKYETLGTKVVIIDYAVLDILTSLCNNIDFKIVVTRDNDKRKEGLIEREGENVANLLEAFYTNGKYNFIAKGDYEIKNNSNLDSLYSQAELSVNSIISKKQLDSEANSKPQYNRHYSYYIVRPDGIRHFNKIYADLEKLFPTMESVRFFKINNYSSIMKKIYYKLFEELPKEMGFAESFDSYLRTTNSLYGNEGILIILSELHKTEDEYKEFMQKILNAKMEIREKLMDPNVRIMEKLPDSYNGNKNRIINYEGDKYRVGVIKALSRIHCPDDNSEDTNTELGILYKSGIISNANMFDQTDIDNAIDFGSISKFNGGTVEHRPDIAGYEKKNMSKAIGINDEIEI